MSLYDFLNRIHLKDIIIGLYHNDHAIFLGTIKQIDKEFSKNYYLIAESIIALDNAYIIYVENEQEYTRRREEGINDSFSFILTKLEETINDINGKYTRGLLQSMYYHALEYQRIRSEWNEISVEAFRRNHEQCKELKLFIKDAETLYEYAQIDNKNDVWKYALGNEAVRYGQFASSLTKDLEKVQDNILMLEAKTWTQKNWKQIINVLESATNTVDVRQYLFNQGFTKDQVQIILSMRLGNLCNEDIIKISEELLRLKKRMSLYK